MQSSMVLAEKYREAVANLDIDELRDVAVRCCVEVELLKDQDTFLRREISVLRTMVYRLRIVKKKHEGDYW